MTLPAAAPPAPPIVGLGASAGGLDALTRFVAALPARTGAAYVVVLHLHPDHDSLMPELLGSHTSLPVAAAAQGQRVEPDHVYVIPPNRQLQVAAGLLQLETPESAKARQTTIDRFFRSLAAEQRERAIGIVLSGTGTEGTLGLAAIKAEGGLTMAQAPATAAHPGMPARAIAAGVVDLVLSPEDMPAALLPHLQQADRQDPSPEPGGTAQADGLDAVLALVRERTHLDFRAYKAGTLQRRIERRMRLRQIPDVADYARHLHDHPAELDQLARDLLIRVTSFFRDAPAFDELATRVIAPLARTASDVPIRIWVPGCATGEEAYSLAIVVAEQAEAARSQRRVQIFATDVDPHALDIARIGVYPATIGLDVSDARLKRFFTRTDGACKVSPLLRESVVFAAHDVLADAPFSRVDLVSCRNVLIYLQPPAQRRLMAVFHRALSPGGHLFLGESETVGRADDLFAPVSSGSRLYVRLNGGLPLPAPVPVAAPRRRAGAPGTARDRITHPTLATMATRQLLAGFAPPAVVVDGGGRLLHVFGSIGPYFELPTGAAVLDAASMIREPLKAAFLEALRRASMARAQVSVDAPPFSRRRTRVRFTAAPLAGPTPAHAPLLVAIEALPRVPAARAPRPGGRSRPTRALQTQLRSTRREQRQLVEQLAASNDDLRAANDAVTAINEELQSANDELQGSKEALQSMNEELNTVNAQLQERLRELTTVNDDLSNILAATDTAAVFLDGALRLTRFTPAAARLLALTPADVGRPIDQVTGRLVGFDARDDARRVLADLGTVEHVVTARDGARYRVRVLPYRRRIGVTEGVVMTVSDLTPAVVAADAPAAPPPAAARALPAGTAVP